MKRIISNIKYTATALFAVLCMSSCEDFLSTVPLNEIVLENFWENEDEVTSVVASCYSGMTDNNFLTRIMLWGEMRSDNMSKGLINAKTPFVNDVQLPEMLDGNILPNYYIADWSSFYTVINRCNTVLHYAPEVLERDPDFTESEWKAMEAEMLTLRALCYFYLVRTFRDIPMVLEPTIDDSKPFIMAAADPDSVLNQIVKDLKKAEMNAVKKYPETSSSSLISYTKGRVTQQAVWALLADVALWMENYDECIAYCEKVIAAKVEDAKEERMTYDGEYPLLANQKASSTSNIHQAYNLIFGTGNSFESIFELQIDYTYDKEKDFLRSYYGALDVDMGALSASSFLAEGTQLGNKYFTKTDIRPYGLFDVKDVNVYSIRKYVASYIDDQGEASKRLGDYANWILYRLTDVMLMEAEALVERNDSMANDLRKAFDLTNAVYSRSNLSALDKDSLAFSSYGTQSEMRDLVLLERQRELMFEGKRWFDLVRKARREGTNGPMLDLAKRKYNKPEAVKSKWIKPDMLYLPIYEEELKVNTLLKQNPEYKTTETISTAK
ncbi:MAG: RagB/SusD family nutrient uptake outer membrane protein [Bacteroidaceae bacterium]|nr:RagB/SusD family nutrient uptake outer membrane protein [Bacteroidaceae bacterium]